MEEIEVDARFYMNGSLHQVTVSSEGDYLCVRYPDRTEYRRRNTIGHRITIHDNVYLINGVMPIMEDAKRSCYPNASLLKDHVFLYIEGLIDHKDHPLIVKETDVDELLALFLPTKKEVDLLG